MTGAELAIDSPDAVARSRAAAALGHRGAWPAGTAKALTELAAHDDDAAVRRAALSALLRRAHRSRALAAWRTATHDPDASVRRADAAAAPALWARHGPEHAPLTDPITGVLSGLLGDRDALVAEAAAFALGEVVPDQPDASASSAALDLLVRHAGGHGEALVREACVAALGALRAAEVDGADRALPTILAAARDKPAIRRRAVIALAAFDSPAADAALQAALGDRDWQTRQLAEDLSGTP